MKITELKPIVSNKTEFHLSKVKFIPVEHGCYVLTNYLNDILYIYSDDNHHTYIGFFYSENFLTLADFREQRINSILND